MNPAKKKLDAQAEARRLRSYRHQLPETWRQNRAQARNLRKAGVRIDQILRSMPRLAGIDDELAAAISTQWVRDATGDVSPEAADLVDALVNSATDFELIWREHDRLVAKLAPAAFAEILAEIDQLRPPQEQDDQPAMQTAREIIACHNGISAVTDMVALLGVEPEPVLAKVYGEHLPAMRALVSRLQEAGQQRQEDALRIEGLRAREGVMMDDPRRETPGPETPGPETSGPDASGQDIPRGMPTRSESVAARSPGTALTGATTARVRPEVPAVPEAEIKAVYAAEKKAMLARLKKEQAAGRSLFDIIAGTPKPPCEKLDDARACALVGIYCDKAIQPVAGHETEVAARLVESARQFEIVRRARARLVSGIDPQPLAALLEQHGAKRLASSYIEMAKMYCSRPDCLEALKMWMASKLILPQPALAAIFGDQLAEIEHLEHSLAAILDERAYAAAELEHMRLSRGDPAYGLRRESAPLEPARPCLQEIFVRDLDRRIQVEEGGRTRRRTRRELVIEMARKKAPGIPKLFKILTEIHARCPQSRTEEPLKVADVQAARLASCEAVMARLGEKRQARGKAAPRRHPLRRNDNAGE